MGKKDHHPNKEIRAAIEYAIGRGWVIRKGGKSSHCWGTLRCPMNDKECRCGEFCVMSVWSTPRVPENMAAQIRRVVDGCTALDAAASKGKAAAASAATPPQKTLKKPTNPKR